MTENIEIKINDSNDEIYVKVNGNDYYYDKPFNKDEAVLRSVFKFLGYEPDYYLDGATFNE